MIRRLLALGLAAALLAAPTAAPAAAVHRTIRAGVLNLAARFPFQRTDRRVATAPPAWGPTSLGSSLKGWWSADDHGTARMTDDGAGLISSWTDKVGGVVVSATGTARPTWSATAVGGAKAGVGCDGVANNLTSTAYTALPTGTTAGEVWIVGTQDQPSTTAGQFYLLRIGSVAPGSRALQRVVAGTTNRVRVTDGTTSLTDTAIDLTGPMIVMGEWSGTTETGRVNGQAISPASSTITSINTNTTRMRICANTGNSAATFGQLTIRHIFVTLPLTLLQQQQLEGWAAWDAGQAAAMLPAIHPYRLAAP